MLPTLKSPRQHGARIALRAFYFQGMMVSDARKVNDGGPDLSTNFGDEVLGARYSIVRKRDSRGIRRSQVSRNVVRCDGTEVGLPGS